MGTHSVCAMYGMWHQVLCPTALPYPAVLFCAARTAWQASSLDWVGWLAEVTMQESSDHMVVPASAVTISNSSSYNPCNCGSRADRGRGCCSCKFCVGVYKQ